MIVCQRYSIISLRMCKSITKLWISFVRSIELVSENKTKNKRTFVKARTMIWWVFWVWTSSCEIYATTTRCSCSTKCIIVYRTVSCKNSKKKSKIKCFFFLVKNRGWEFSMMMKTCIIIYNYSLKVWEFRFPITMRKKPMKLQNW